MAYEQIDSVKIGSRLRAIRTERGESVEYLAKSIGVSNSAIGMYEGGQRVPRDEIKIKIAEHFNMPVELIFFATA